MKKLLITLSIVLFRVVPSYNTGNTHSGRTDKYGGHHDRINGGYHYHNSGTVSKPHTSTPTIPKVRSTTTKQGDMLYTPTRLE